MLPYVGVIAEVGSTSMSSSARLLARAARRRLPLSICNGLFLLRNFMLSLLSFFCLRACPAAMPHVRSLPRMMGRVGCTNYNTLSPNCKSLTKKKVNVNAGNKGRPRKHCQMLAVFLENKPKKRNKLASRPLQTAVFVVQYGRAEIIMPRYIISSERIRNDVTL